MKKLLLPVLLVCAAYAENTNTVPPPPVDMLYQGSFSPDIVRPGIALYFTLGRDENGDNVPDMSIHTWEQGTLIFYGSAKQGGSFTCPKADTP